jgi:hypothetical protein
MQVRGKKEKVPAVQKRGTKGSTESGNGRLMIPDEIFPLLEATSKHACCSFVRIIFMGCTFEESTTHYSLVESYIRTLFCKYFLRTVEGFFFLSTPSDRKRVPYDY